MKYFVRTNRSPAAEGPFDLERARCELRTLLQAEQGRGHTLHEGQRGIWLIASGAVDAELAWIADKKDRVVPLGGAPAPRSGLH